MGDRAKAKEKQTITPLYAAARKGHLGILLLLIDAGASVDLVVGDSTGKQPMPPLITAAANGNEECVRALLHAGADAALTYTDSDGKVGKALWWAEAKGNEHIAIGAL